MINTTFTCSDQLTYILNNVKSKTIDTSNMQILTGTYPPNNTVGWYKTGNSNSGGGVTFFDTRDVTYNYLLMLTIYGNPDYPGCCNTNPVNQCICNSNSTDMPCIFTSTFDKNWVFTNLDIPQNITDQALSMLPGTISGIKIGNFNIPIMYILIGGGAVGAYLIFFGKKKRKK